MEQPPLNLDAVPSFYESLAGAQLKAKFDEVTHALHTLLNKVDARITLKELNKGNILTQPTILFDSAAQRHYVALLTLQAVEHESCCGVFYSPDFISGAFHITTFSLPVDGRLSSQRVFSMPDDVIAEITRQLKVITKESPDSSGFLYLTVSGIRDEESKEASDVQSENQG